MLCSVGNFSGHSDNARALALWRIDKSWADKPAPSGAFSAKVAAHADLSE
jgi:hypothetical protein